MPIDVLVAGGGPAGAVTAALLAKEGVRVVLLERERHPRHHVGESLQPASMELLDRHFGLGPALAAQGFARKYGAVYVWGETREPWSVLFDDRLERELPGLDEAGLLSGGYLHAWQVERSKFDHMLIEAAAAQGVDVRQEIEVTAPIVEDGRVTGLRTSAGDLHARFVIDATGQRRLLGRAFGLVEDIADMRATATYTYFEGAGGVPGPLGRHVQLVVAVDEGWIWFIPVSAGLTSVGVVVRERARLDDARFHAILARAELPLAGARQVPGPLLHTADWSYQTRTAVGPGFLLAGDAACFVDPILSGGVDFAIRGAANATVAVLRELEGQPGVAAYDERLRKEFRAYLRLARYWYGNNRSVQGLFWEAHEEVPPGSVSTPLRAFVYLTSGRYAADTQMRVFAEWQERKMFRALGVDKAALARARKRER